MTSQKNDVIGVARFSAAHGCGLVFDDHCQTYRNLLPNCNPKCQITVPIWTV